MNLPLPTLYLKTFSEHEKWMRKMYELGYRYGTYSNVNEGLTKYACDQNRAPDDSVSYPWVTLAYGRYIAPDCTQLNSIRHFIEYTKRLERES